MNIPYQFSFIAYIYTNKMWDSWKRHQLIIEKQISTFDLLNLSKVVIRYLFKKPQVWIACGCHLYHVFSRYRVFFRLLPSFYLPFRFTSLLVFASILPSFWQNTRIHHQFAFDGVGETQFLIIL